MKAAEQYARAYLIKEVEQIENSNRKNENTGLTIYEKAIIYKYSFDGFEDLNESLRKSKGKDISEFGKLLDSSLIKLLNYEGLVYRAAYLTKNEIKRYTDALKVNELIKEYSFISTSKSRFIASAFGGNCLFRIYSRTGKDIEKIAKFGTSEEQNEREVLIRPNTNFRILEITKESTFTLITMEEV